MPDASSHKEAPEEKVYQIGEVAEITGLTHRTLRYYEELGLLGERDHPPGKHRVYTAADIERLSRIQRFKDVMGHQLGEIKVIFELDEERKYLREEAAAAGSKQEKAAKLQRVREIFETELGIVRERMGRLNEVEQLLTDRIEGVDKDLEKLD